MSEGEGNSTTVVLVPGKPADLSIAELAGAISSGTANDVSSWRSRRTKKASTAPSAMPARASIATIDPDNSFVIIAGKR
jgi:hypothetical protein